MGVDSVLFIRDDSETTIRHAIECLWAGGHVLVEGDRPLGIAGSLQAHPDLPPGFRIRMTGESILLFVEAVA